LLEHGERRDVGLLLRRVGAPGSERHLHLDARGLRGLLDARRAAENDEVCERDLHAVSALVELLLHRLEAREHLGELVGVVHCPVLLGSELTARAIGATALVGAAERGGRSPRRPNELTAGIGSCHESSSFGTSAPR
jgi:hypothetical protein